VLFSPVVPPRSGGVFGIFPRLRRNCPGYPRGFRPGVFLPSLLTAVHRRLDLVVAHLHAGPRYANCIYRGINRTDFLFACWQNSFVLNAGNEGVIPTVPLIPLTVCNIGRCYTGDNGWIVGDAINTVTGRADAFLPTPVREPETCAMLLAGLGLLVFMGRHRKQNPVTATRDCVS
jgi:hypothetical protein